MRQIEKQMNFAVSNKGNFKKANTEVSYNENTNCSTVVLHRTAIAVYDHNTQALKLNTGGWHSVTTKSRLNAILQELIAGASVYQHQFKWFLDYNNLTHNFWDGMILSNGEVV